MEEEKNYQKRTDSSHFVCVNVRIFHPINFTGVGRLIVIFECQDELLQRRIMLEQEVSALERLPAVSMAIGRPVGPILYMGLLGAVRRLCVMVFEKRLNPKVIEAGESKLGANVRAGRWYRRRPGERLLRYAGAGQK